MMRFFYSVISFVPDPVRREAVNIGVVLGSNETREWELRTVGSLRRARMLDDNKVLSKVIDSVEWIGRQIDNYVASQETLFPSMSLSEGWLKRLSEDSQNLMQLSSPAPIAAPSIEIAMDLVFEEFIIDPVSRQLPFQKKNSALASLRQAYGAQGLSDGLNYFEKQVVDGSYHREAFDFLVLNGRAVQLAQGWSFQVPDQDELIESVKAWAYTVEDIRTNGGHVRIGGRLVNVDREIDIEVVYVLPRPGSNSVMGEALEAFKKVNVNPVPRERAAEVAAKAARLLGRQA